MPDADFLDRLRGVFESQDVGAFRFDAVAAMKSRA